MAFQNMYQAVVNSPQTSIVDPLQPTDTTIIVQDSSRIPAAPNLLVISADNTESTETVRLIAKNGNILTVERGFQGSARAWSANALIARNYTAYDHDTFIANINDVSNRLNTAADQLSNDIAGVADDVTSLSDDLTTMGTTLDNKIDTTAAAMVPKTRTVNGKALSSNITLTASDVGALTLDKIYPVGSIYMSTSSANPSATIGGTWESWGAGRVPVGVDTSQTEFNTVQKEGGNKYMQSHNHSASGLSVATTSLSGTLDTRSITGSTSGFLTGASGIIDYTVQGGSSLSSHVAISAASRNADRATINASHTHSISGSTASSGSGTGQNLQPYITCYMWRRTA